MSFSGKRRGAYDVRQRRRLVVVLFTLCTGIPAHAQGIEWETLNDQTTSLYRQGQYDQAVVVTKKALRVAEKALGPDHPLVAVSLNTLAELYRDQGQYAQAEPLYRRSLAILEKARGPIILTWQPALTTSRKDENRCLWIRFLPCPCRGCMGAGK